MTNPRQQGYQVQFTLGGETKNTMVYTEVRRQSGLPPMIRTLYIRKEQYEEMGRPDDLVVTVTPYPLEPAVDDLRIVRLD